MRSNSVRVSEGDERVVVRLDSSATDIELGVHLKAGTEQHERLIDEMASKIEEESPGFFWCSTLTPGSSGNGTPALETRLEAQGMPHCIIGEEALQGEKVAVPSAVLKDSYEATSPLRLGDD
jgi:hypothetical protein